MGRHLLPDGGAVRRPRRVLRFTVGVVLACAPVAVMSAVGCSSSESSQGMTSVDPGGTYGAEVSLAITGRGRVISTNAGNSIDCPSRCYGRLVLDDKSAPGAPQSVTLKAIPTPGARFLGWEFASDSLGTRGRGPDECNPVSRPAVSPQVDPTAAEITLPFGEVEGKPPAANAGQCSATYTVPLAYRVVAKFDTTTSNLDGGVDGGDAGGGDVFVQPPQVGAIAREIGLSGSYLYWRWDASGSSGISMTSTFGGASASTVQNLGSSVTQFAVTSYGAIWQRSDGSLSYVTSGSTSASSLFGAPTCVAVTLDSQGAYCRSSAGQIVSWTLGGTGPTVQYTNVPTGYDLATDGSYFYFSTDPGTVSGGSILYATRPGPGDGGTFNTVVSSRTGPQKLQVNSSRLLWLESSGGTSTVNTNSSRFSSIAYTAVGPATGLFALAPDTSSTYVWGATSSTITRGYYAGGQQTTFKSGLVGVGGIAVDSSYVYWTQTDGRVYRASRSGL